VINGVARIELIAAETYILIYSQIWQSSVNIS